MKKAFLPVIMFSIFLFPACDSLEEALAGAGPVIESSGLSEEEVIAGLKEALEVGFSNTVENVSVKDGFRMDPEISIPFMEDASDVEKKLRDIGLGNQVDRFVVQLNRAAEDASGHAADIFMNAIRDMSISDAWSVLKSEDMHAATHYLRQETEADLRRAFSPQIMASIEAVELTKYWEPLATAYNNIPFIGQQVTTDLEDYVMDKTMDGLFLKLEQEEEKIRTDPAARVTELLQKVFGQ